MSGFFYKPSKKDIDELDNKLKMQSEKLKANKIRLAEKDKILAENKRRLQALRDFKAKTGLIGQELKKAFDEYWNNGNPKEIKEEKPKKGRPKKKSEEEQAEERAFLANKAEMKQYLSSLVYSDKIDKEMKNKILEGNLMKGRSDLKKNKNGKMCIETEININNDIDDKVKRALLKSIIEELNKNFDEYEFFYQKKN